MFILTIISAVYLNMSLKECPLLLKLFPQDEIIVKASGNIPYSFANWEDGVTVEVSQGTSSYGPYSNKKKVFGVYFENDIEIEILNPNNQYSKFVIGCYAPSIDNTDDFHNPHGFKPVGSYNYDYKLTNYPILFTDDQGASMYYIGIGLLFGLTFIASYVLYFRSDQRYELCYAFPFLLCLFRLLLGNRRAARISGEP